MTSSSTSTAAAAPVVLILGSGPNVGASVAKHFAAGGYRVAVTSRTIQDADSDSPYLSLRVDLSNENSIVDVFSQVRKQLGEPSVVVYNAVASISNPPDDPLALKASDLEHTLAVNVTGLLVAAQQSVKSFVALPQSASRTFIYTGNCLNWKPMNGFLSLGIGKSAGAHLISSAAEKYKALGYKFYYGDERRVDGEPANAGIDGEAHGKRYFELSQHTEQGPWLQTFVKGMGAVSFTLNTDNSWKRDTAN